MKLMASSLHFGTYDIGFVYVDAYIASNVVKMTKLMYSSFVTGNRSYVIVAVSHSTGLSLHPCSYIRLSWTWVRINLFNISGTHRNINKREEMMLLLSR